MTETKDAQINVPMKKSWKDKLEKIARTKAYKENRRMTVYDLVRETLNEAHNLEND